MAVYCSSFIFTLCVKQFQCKTILNWTPHSLSHISRAKMFCGQDQRSDLCGARTHDYCLSAGKQQPPTAQATPTGTPAPLHTHSKTLEKLLQLLTTQNNTAKQELFWKWPNINKHQGVVIWAKQTFLTTFKSSSNSLPKRGEILSTHKTFSSLPYFGYSLSPFD